MALHTSVIHRTLMFPADHMNISDITSEEWAPAPGGQGGLGWACAYPGNNLCVHCPP